MDHPTYIPSFWTYTSCLCSNYMNMFLCINLSIQ